MSTAVTPTSEPASKEHGCTILRDVSLEVKAYAQPLGQENAWSELGEGTVEIVGGTVRVMPFPAAHQHVDTDEDCDGDQDSARQLKEAMERQSDEPLLEDTLGSDTQLVGRDSCIVWNSAEQELSFCIMFASDIGYDATHAAFNYVIKHATDDSWEHDFFAPLMAEAATPADFATELALQLEEAATLGFIERHAVVLSLIRGDYAAVPGVIGNEDVCHNLLSMHHPEVIEYLLHDSRFPLFLAANSAPPSPSNEHAAVGDRTQHVDWQLPPKLRGLPFVDMVSAVMTRVSRLHALRPTKGPAEAHPVVETLEAVTQRQLGQVLMQLTTSEDFLAALGGGLVEACESGPSEDPDAAEQHLRCLADLLELSCKIHTRDGAPPAVVHIFLHTDGLAGLAAVAKLLRRRFHGGLQTALCRVLDSSLVLLNQKGDEVAMAAVFRDPIVRSAAAASAARPDSLAPFMAYLVSTCIAPTAAAPSAEATPSSSREASESPVKSLDGTKKPSASLAVTRTEPGAAFVSLASFLPSTHVASVGGFSGSSSNSNKSAPPATAHGSFYLYHLLGLHDDEGTTVDRAPTAEAVESRAAIQRHMVSHCIYSLLQACGAQNALPEPVAMLLDHLLRLTTADNRDRLLSLCLSSRSPLLPLLKAHGGGRSKAELCSNMRLVKAVLTAMLGLSQKELRPLAYRMTFEHDIWGVYVARLKADRRGNSMAHCVFNSILDLFAVQVHNSPSTDTLDPIRRYVVLKYRVALPTKFVENVEAAELAALASDGNSSDYSSPVPFVSPSRAPSPAITAAQSISPRRAREAEEVLPPDQKHHALTNRLRALVAHAAGEHPAAGTSAPPPGATAPPAEPGRNEPHVQEAARAAPLSAMGAAAAPTPSHAARGATTASNGHLCLTVSGSKLATDSSTVAVSVEPTPPAAAEAPNKPRRPTAPLVARKSGRRVPLKGAKALMN
jgi:hypothetical protein